MAVRLWSNKLQNSHNYPITLPANRSNKRKCWSLAMIFWLNMSTDWWTNWRSWVTNLFCKKDGRRQLRNLLLITFGTRKTEGRLKDRWPVSLKDSKADCTKCRREEGDWSSISTKRRENLMSSKKASTKASVRRAPSSRSSVLSNLKTSWELQPKMWHKKLSPVWSHLKVALVFSLKFKTSVSRTTSKERQTQPTTLLTAKALIHRLHRDTTTLKWRTKTAQEVDHLGGTWWLQARTRQTRCIKSWDWAARAKCQSRDSKVRQWTKGSREASQERTMTTAQTANMRKSTTNTTVTLVIWAPPECHRSAALKSGKNES